MLEGLVGVLQVRPHVNIAGRNLRRANEYMSTIAASSVHTDRVLARVRSRGIKRNFPSLTAVLGIRRPGGLVPPILEALGHLSGGNRRKSSQSEECGLSEHRCCWSVGSWKRG
jgi:hypothetical protein